MGLHYSLDVLSQKLGISKKTIYFYFQNKEMLIEHTISVKLNEFEMGFKTILKGRLHPINELKQITFFGRDSSLRTISEKTCAIPCLLPFMKRQKILS
ncbi:TetR family transcriptional regulator [Maribacter sp.]